MTDSLSQELRIGPDREVTLHFALKLENGDVVDSTFDKQPATFKVGDGNLLPGFEQALFGLKAGDRVIIDNLMKLKPGATVVPHPPQAAGAPGAAPGAQAAPAKIGRAHV